MIWSKHHCALALISNRESHCDYFQGHFVTIFV